MWNLIWSPRRCISCWPSAWSASYALFAELRWQSLQCNSSGWDRRRRGLRSFLSRKGAPSAWGLVLRAATLGQIQAALANTSFQSLQHSGYQLVAQGVVPFEEIDRAIGRDQRTEQ